MVLGLFEGSVEIITNKSFYSPGESVTGRIKLNLNQSKQADALRLRFYGELRNDDSSGRIHQREVIISGKKTYPQGQSDYPFELKLPIIKKQKMEGIVGSVMGFFDPVKRARWYLSASLDVKMSFDIYKRRRIDFHV